jgi:hypothetical protein
VSHGGTFFDINDYNHLRGGVREILTISLTPHQIRGQMRQPRNKTIEVTKVALNPP